MVKVIVDAHEHGRIKSMAEMVLNAEVEPLSCGDFWVQGVGYGDQAITVMVERRLQGHNNHKVSELLKTSWLK